MAVPVFVHPKEGVVEEITALLSRNDLPKRRSSTHPQYGKMGSNDRLELALWMRSLDSIVEQRYDPIFSSVAIEYAYLTGGLDGARKMFRRIKAKFEKYVSYRSSPGARKDQSLLNDFEMYEGLSSDVAIPFELRNATLCSGPSFKGISEVGKPVCDDVDFYERCFEKLDQLLRSNGREGILDILDAKHVDIYTIPKRYQIIYPIGVKWTGLGISVSELSTLMMIMNHRISLFLEHDPKDRSEFPIFDEAIRSAYEDAENDVPRPEGRGGDDVKMEFTSIFPRMQCSLATGRPILVNCDCYIGPSATGRPRLVPYDGLTTRMNKAQEAYYRYWKSCFENGMYLDATIGYLKRYARECMVSDDDHETVLARIQAIEDQYNLDMSCESLFYRLEHDMSMPVWNGSSPVEFPHEIALCVWDTIRSDPMGHLGRYAVTDLLRNLLPEVDSYPVFTVELIDNALVALDNYSKENNLPRLSDIIKQHVPEIKYLNLNSIFEKRKVYKIPISNPVEYYDIYVFFNVAVRTVLKPLYVKMMRRPLPIPSEGLSSEQKKFLSVFSDAWIEHRYSSPNSKAVSCAKVRELSRNILDYVDYVYDRTFALNRDDISKATDDLEAVREMMSVDDEEIHEADESLHHIMEQSHDEGWVRFFKEIGEHGRAYLIHSLNGMAREYCSDNDMKINVVEASINNLAMDIIGDMVVMNGSIVDEYINDIKSIKE